MSKGQSSVADLKTWSLSPWRSARIRRLLWVIVLLVLLLNVWTPWTTLPKAKYDPMDDEYLAFCMAVKDQGLDLPEFFLHHYHHHNIRRFYIMDDGSIPPLSSFSYPIPREFITFVYHDASMKRKEMQYVMYNECIAHFGPRHTWMAFLDADEFFETRGNHTMHSLLRALEKNNSVGALAVQWRVHNSAGLLKRPKSVRKAFTRCTIDPTYPEYNVPLVWGSDNRHIKSIVKTAAYVRPMNPHVFFMKGKNLTVGENGHVIKPPATQQPLQRDKIVMHHYIVKSKEEFAEKTRRKSAMNISKKADFWNAIESLRDEECFEMAKYNP